MKKFITITFLVILAGCSSAPVKKDLIHIPQVKTNDRNLIDIGKIKLGMSPEEVKGVLDSQLAVGYHQAEYPAGSFETLTVKQPYRDEVLEVGGNVYDVLYYLTSVKIPDGIIAQDEMTPLVFLKDKLVGKDWDFYYSLKK